MTEKPTHTDSPSFSTDAVWLWAGSAAIGGVLTGVLEGTLFQFLATLVLSGFLVGAAQWLIFRQLIGGWLWIAASGVGWFVGYTLIGIWFNDLINPLVEALTQIGLWEVFWLNAVNSLIGAGVMAGLQLLLIGDRLNHPGLWVLVGGVAGAASGAAGATTCYAVCDALGSTGILGLATGVSYGAAWLAYGVVSGWGLKLLWDDALKSAQ